MCSDHPPPSARTDTDRDDPDAPPSWEDIVLPPDEVLSRLTDTHCHPTDLTHNPAVYDNVKLGGLASMATTVTDQELVKSLSETRPWSQPNSNSTPSSSNSTSPGPKVVACFGYHPWFVHRYTLLDPPPTKEDHYRQIFLPTSTKYSQLLTTLLPYLPEPIPFQPLLHKLRDDIATSLGAGRLTMLGEVGLDGGARMKWPVDGRHLYVEKYPSAGSDGIEEEKEEWKRLTPFKTCMQHQRDILIAQMEVAVDLGVNVSSHSVASAGPTYDVLIHMRNKHRTRFTNRINVDLHSGGGWSAEYWKGAEKNLSNLYISPSIAITSRSQSAPALLRAISPSRLLVESDTHDVRQCDRLVWAAVVWIARVRGWRVEGVDSSQEGGLGGSQDKQGVIEEEEEEFESDGRIRQVLEDERRRWIVSTLERNWARFMRLVPD